MKKNLFILLLISLNCFAQKSVHNYKYVIIPSKFDFVKQTDKYQTSSLTKFLFEKEGFVAFLDNEQLPESLTLNKCLALNANVKDASSMFTTKSIIELKDCTGKVIFTGTEGRSKQKDYKRAYHEAIRAAFEPVKRLNYNYKPVKGRNGEEALVLHKPQKVNNRSEVSRRNNPSRKQIETSERKQNNTTASRVPVLQAKLIKDGYQLLNVKGNVVYNVLYTTLKDVFVLKGRNGIFYKEGGNWLADFYNQNGEKITKVYQLETQLR